jgi:hypothetical protein
MFEGIVFSLRIMTIGPKDVRLDFHFRGGVCQTLSRQLPIGNLGVVGHQDVVFIGRMGIARAAIQQKQGSRYSGQ